MNVLVFKWLSIVTLCITMVTFYNELLPPYYTITTWDKWFWISILGILAIVQSALLIYKVHKCYLCRMWSDFVLQVTGLVFVAMTGVFSMMYPPFSWVMGVFPTIGILYLVAGRAFSRRSRQYLRRHYGNATNYQQ